MRCGASILPDDTRAQNRADFPLAAVCVDEFKRVFGDEVKFIWACENGREIGRRSASGIPVVVGPSIDAIEKKMRKHGA